MSSLLPLKQKVDILWSYNSQVFSPEESHINGQLGILFLYDVDKIKYITYGLCGEYIFEDNNLLTKNKSGILFNQEKILNISSVSKFKKNQQIVENLDLSFPYDKIYLPSSCLYYGDDQNYETTLSVKYYLYVKIAQIGSNKSIFSTKKDKVNTFTFPLTYQSCSLFESINNLSYKELNLYKLSSHSKNDLDLVVELNIPSFIDMNLPFFNQFNLKFITNTAIDTLDNLNFHIKHLKLSIYYYSTFANKKSVNNYEKKKNLFQLSLQNSLIGLKNFKFDSTNSYYYQNYQITESPNITLKDLVGLHSFLTTCEILDGKFANTSCLHLTFKIVDDFNVENIYKFRTESSLTVSPSKVYKSNSFDNQTLDKNEYRFDYSDDEKN